MESKQGRRFTALPNHGSPSRRRSGQGFRDSAMVLGGTLSQGPSFSIPKFGRKLVVGGNRAIRFISSCMHGVVGTVA